MTAQNEALLNRIKEFALRNENVRALALIGSSVRDDGLGDEFSDIDLFLVSDEPSLFVEGASWARGIGECWFSFSESVPDARHRERRFLFSGGLDVDFVVIDEADLRDNPDVLFIAKAIASGGIRVLVDKGGLAPALLALRDEPKAFRFPEADAFLNQVSDFYFHCVWATKKCLRGEYWVALQCVNGYLKARTLSMLECYERVINGLDYDTRYDGRYLERWVDPDLKGEIAGSFASYDRGDILRAIDAGLSLYRKASRAIASYLNVPYPETEAERVRAWIDTVRRER